MGADTDEGQLIDEFLDIHAGRRLVLEYPISPSTRMQVVVLDSADTLGVEFVMKCAAMLVPSGQEMDWMYSSEGGQWQLLASAGVSRLILFSRMSSIVHSDKKGKRMHRHDNHRQEKRMEPHDEPRDRRSMKAEEQQRASKLSGPTNLPTATPEDEALKHLLGPLVLALAPKVAFDSGVPSIPFLSYSDNVVQRLLVEEASSPLTGLMKVEDVEVEGESSDLEAKVIQQNNCEGISSQLKSRKQTRSWRRRLIFRRMPNLIQTEVLLTIQRCDSKRQVLHKGRESGDEGRRFLKHKNNLNQEQLDHINLDRVVRHVDHSRLVHKYLPPIIAGFVLVAPRLDAFFKSDAARARVLSIGVGGGALPIFLQQHFRFHIQAIDLDVGVLQLARKHFGLKEDTYFQVTVGDGLTVVEEIAARAIRQGIVDEGRTDSWTSCLPNGESFAFASQHGLWSPAETLKLFASPSRKDCNLNEGTCHIDGNLRKGDGGFVQGVEESSMACPPELSGREHKLTRDPYMTGQSEVSSSSHLTTSSHDQKSQSDPRVDLIILDVDVGDARLGLSSPPQSFLERRFLHSAKIALAEGGMLAMNVVPCGEKPFAGVIESLTAVFAEVYEIALEDDVNHVVFALPSPVSLNHQLLNSHTVDQVKKVVGEKFIQHIRRLDNSSSKE
ncbi:unnamed protein product [Calypogeia fissa]